MLPGLSEVTFTFVNSQLYMLFPWVGVPDPSSFQERGQLQVTVPLASHTVSAATPQLSDMCEMSPLIKKESAQQLLGMRKGLLVAANLSPAHWSLTLNIQTQLQAMYSEDKTQ